MKKSLFPILVVVIAASFKGCGSDVSFPDQIKNDVVSKMGTGICDSIPAGSVIKNVVVGEITPIERTPLIDVAIEYDFECNNETTHKSGAVLYSKQGSTYYLEALGGCEYSRK